MIAEFKVKNFLSIKTEQILSFEPTTDTLMRDEYTVEVKEGVRLLKMALIYGANASGKTNILAALSFFRDLMLDIPKDKMEETGVTPFLLDNSSRNEPTEFTLSFYLEKERYVLYVQCDKDRIYEETLTFYPTVRPAKLYTRRYNIDTDSTDIEFGNLLGLSKKGKDALASNTFNNCSLLAAFGKTNVERSKLNLLYDFFTKHMPEILRPSSSLESYIKGELKKDKDNNLSSYLVDVLKASDFNICGLDLQEEETAITPEMEKMIQSAPVSDKTKQELLQKGKITNYELLFKHYSNEGEFELSEELESRGTIRFMGMSIILRELLYENNIVSIDEVETSLHYELLSYFIKVFLANSQNASQLILTTHDINLLNESFIRRDAVWFTDKDSLGQTHLVRLSSFGLHKNLSPYNAYKQGKLVNLPFFDSIYLKDNSLCEEK